MGGKSFGLAGLVFIAVAFLQIAGGLAQQAHGLGDVDGCGGHAVAVP